MSKSNIFECTIREEIIRCADVVVNSGLQSDVWQPILSTFAGAVFAFSVARFTEWTKRYRERLAAGNFALFALQTQ